MEEEKGESIINEKLFKPSGLLYIFLFIYYTIWLVGALGGIGYFITTDFEDFYGYRALEWINVLLFILVGFYVFYALIKTLRGDSDCITALKFSLIILILYTIFNEVRGEIPTHKLWIRIVVFYIRPVFYLVFYLYLCFSNGIKRYYPKKDRRFAPSGLIWSVLICLCLCSGGLTIRHQYLISQHCKRIDPSAISLPAGKVTDGYIILNSNRDWEPVKEKAGKINIEDWIQLEMTMQSVDTTGKISLFSGKYNLENTKKKGTVRLHNLIVALLMEDDQSMARGAGFADTVINENRVISDIFRIDRDSVSWYFTIMTILEEVNAKCCVLVDVRKGEHSERRLIDMCESLQFDLFPYHLNKGIDKIADDQK